jgi:phage terminase small subunit
VWEFVLNSGNATAAHLKAFPGGKYTSAKSNSARLLKDERIQQRIEEVKSELKRRYSVSAESLVFYLSQVLNLDRRAFLDDDGDPKPAEQLDTEAARILDLDFITDRHGKQKAVYRLPTKMQSAVELARMMGLHKDKLELSGDGSSTKNSLESLMREISETRDLVAPADSKTIEG